jgi:uroporphyrinogen-III synthase
MKILVTRPLQDGQEMAALLAAMGHQALLAPLLETQFHDGPEPGLEDVQAVLATSANGIRALARRTVQRDVAIFAVGPQTAEEARKAGFSDIRSANGDAAALAQAAARWTEPDRGVLLHVCGEEVPGNLADTLTRRGFSVRRCALYRVQAAAELPPQVQAALRDGTLDAAMFFSPRSAAIFRDLAAGLPTQGVIAACISRATAEALGTLAVAAVRIAAEPNQAAMLALMAETG